MYSATAQHHPHTYAQMYMQAGNKNEGPYMLVLAPTRELALQSAEVIAEAGGHCGIKSVCVYGGVPKRDQKIALGGGRGGGCVQVVVATPGRLKDLVGEGACDLSKVITSYCMYVRMAIYYYFIVAKILSCVCIYICQSMLRRFGLFFCSFNFTAWHVYVEPAWWLSCLAPDGRK